jgi:hypothetical protein
VRRGVHLTRRRCNAAAKTKKLEKGARKIAQKPTKIDEQVSTQATHHNTAAWLPILELPFNPRAAEKPHQGGPICRSTSSDTIKNTQTLERRQVIDQAILPAQDACAPFPSNDELLESKEKTRHNSKFPIFWHVWYMFIGLIVISSP